MFMRCRGASIAVVLALVIAAAAPGQALAGEPSAPAAAHPWLQLPDAFFVGRQAVTVPRRVVNLVGGEWPYVAGQSVTLRVFLGGRLIKARMLRLWPAPHRKFGQFHASFASPGSGPVLISITHSATTGLTAFRMRRGLASLDTHVRFGSRGAFVQLIQQRLAALHFYIPRTGVYDQGTGLAIDAYHRLLRWGTSETLDGPTIDRLLDGHGAFRVRFSGHGRHAEGNLSLQLLALVDGSRVQTIYPISSGKPSTPTILGDFHVYSKVPGYLPDGMYDSNFFVRGYAIHGYNPAPDFPASHGCMRLPIVDAPSVFGWLAIGDWVDVYY
jgi:hypothetical protein